MAELRNPDFLRCENVEEAPAELAADSSPAVGGAGEAAASSSQAVEDPKPIEEHAPSGHDHAAATNQMLELIAQKRLDMELAPEDEKTSIKFVIDLLERELSHMDHSSTLASSESAERPAKAAKTSASASRGSRGRGKGTASRGGTGGRRSRAVLDPMSDADEDFDTAVDDAVSHVKYLKKGRPASG